MKRVRLQDVAEKAGVAVNTASVILNNRSYCWASQATQERVFRAAEELGYRASKAAVGKWGQCANLDKMETSLGFAGGNEEFL